jgi:exopolyphosphatase/guanosine-5'-triphosphate,3'-diphosphate pyrophosphatase
MKAIIDLGTNTFHLLIAEVKNGVINEYFKLQIPVKLGKGGIGNNFISEDSFKRGLTALREFRKYLDQFGITQIHAFATSAIRSATNGSDFIFQAKTNFQIEINAIDGDTEASFIYDGVKHSFNFPDEKVLVMDIGGGSVEFIIGHKDQIIWKQSFNIGAARIIEKFYPHDPITEEEILALNSYFDKELTVLANAIKENSLTVLIGAAGSFETLVDIVLKDLEVIPNSLSKNAFEIRRQDFELFYELMITSSIEQRLKLKGMVEFRIEMIVVAAVLMKYVIEKFQIKKIVSSNYSLKEGVLFQE